MSNPAPICINCGEPLTSILEDWSKGVVWGWDEDDEAYYRTDEDYGSEIENPAYCPKCHAAVPDAISDRLEYTT